MRIQIQTKNLRSGIEATLHSRQQKKTITKVLSPCGADDRTRTDTMSPSRDFKGMEKLAIAGFFMRGNLCFRLLKTIDGDLT